MPLRITPHSEVVTAPRPQSWAVHHHIPLLSSVTCCSPFASICCSGLLAAAPPKPGNILPQGLCIFCFLCLEDSPHHHLPRPPRRLPQPLMSLLQPYLRSETGPGLPVWHCTPPDPPAGLLARVAFPVPVITTEQTYFVFIFSLPEWKPSGRRKFLVPCSQYLEWCLHVIGAC